MISTKTSKNLKLISVLLIIYFILFEFIIPQNKFIPQPTSLLESFIHLWTVYNFFFALVSTAIIIYLSILFCYFFIYYFRIVIIKNIINLWSTLKEYEIVKYIPAFFVMIIFSIWFKGSLSAEIIFSILISFSMMIKKIGSLVYSVKKEYIIFAHQTNPHKMFSEVYWKSILPKLISSIYELQIYLWILILIYEFISESFGIGYIFKQAFIFNDIGAIFSVSITTSIFIWLSNILMRLIEKKIVYWSFE